MPTNWTDHPIVSGVTQIRVVHVNELRSAVNQLRQSAGLNQISWTDNPLSTTTPIRAVHINEIVGGVQDLWFRRSLGRLPSWSAGSVPARGRPILASDMNNLRSWVNAYEDAVGLDPQGIDSLSFDPNPPGTAIINQAWVDHVVNLGEALPYQNRLLIRANILARESDNFITSFFNNYAQALSLWSDNGFNVAALFSSDFDVWEHIDSGNEAYHPNHVLDQQGGRANQYILHFAGRAAQFAYHMRNTGLKTFWIWNEPDADGPKVPGQVTPGQPRCLSPQVFGALLYQTSYAIRSEIPDASIYAGSFQLFHRDPGWEQKVQEIEAFLNTMYNYLKNNGMSVNSGPNGYGWDALSINIEGIFDYVYPQVVWDSIRRRQLDHDDIPNIIVGEWGIQNGTFEIGDDSILNMYLAIRLFFPTMYFFSHQYANEAGVDHRSYGTMYSSNVDQNSHEFVVGPDEDWYQELRDELYPRL